MRVNLGGGGAGADHINKSITTIIIYNAVHYLFQQVLLNTRDTDVKIETIFENHHINFLIDIMVTQVKLMV